MTGNTGYIYVPYITVNKVDSVSDMNPNKMIKSRYAVTNVDSKYFLNFDSKSIKREERRKKLERIISKSIDDTINELIEKQNNNNIFFDCNSITSIPENLFDYNSSVTSFQSVFSNCTSITGIPPGLFAGIVDEKEERRINRKEKRELRSKKLKRIFDER